MVDGYHSSMWWTNVYLKTIGRASILPYSRGWVKDALFDRRGGMVRGNLFPTEAKSWEYGRSGANGFVWVWVTRVQKHI